MDDLKASCASIERVEQVHAIVKMYAASVGMVINNNKSAIQLSVETRLPKSLQGIPRLDETTYKYLGSEMMNREVEKKGNNDKTRRKDRGEVGRAHEKSRGIRGEELDPLH